MSYVIGVVAIACAYATLTWPVVQQLELRMPRAVAILLTNILIAFVLASIVYGALPIVSRQGQDLADAFPGALNAVTGVLPENVRGIFATGSAQIVTGFSTYFRELFSFAFAVARSALAVVAAIIMIPILAAYLQIDKARYSAAALTITPERYHPHVRAALQEVTLSVGRAIRGQLVVCAITGTLVFITLTLLGIRFALFIAVLTAIFDVVPYLGGVVAFLPSLLFALSFGGPSRALFVGLALFAVFQFEAQFLGPQIVGRNTRLAPSLIMIVLLAGTAAFGVIGLFLAVPLTAVIAAILRAWYQTQDEATRAAS